MVDGPQESERSGWNWRKLFKLGKKEGEPTPIPEEAAAVVATPLDDLLTELDLSPAPPDIKDKTRAAIEILRETTASLMTKGGIIFDNGIFVEGPLSRTDMPSDQSYLLPVRFRDQGADLRRKLPATKLLRFPNSERFALAHDFDLISCINFQRQEDENVKDEVRDTPFTVVDTDLRSAKLAAEHIEGALLPPLTGLMTRQYEKAGISKNFPIDPKTAASATLTQATAVR